MVPVQDNEFPVSEFFEIVDENPSVGNFLSQLRDVHEVPISQSSQGRRLAKVKTTMFTDKDTMSF